MSSRRNKLPTVLVTTALGLSLAACGSDGPTEVPGVSAAAAEATPQFGPFPGATTIFVDVDNTSGIEDGSRGHPFNTLREGITAARDGDVVGVAPGVYTQTFGPSLTPNYVIDGLRDFKLLGSGPAQTTIRGDHSFSLIRVQNGASGLIKGFTIEHGGHISHSEGGGIQVIGRPNPVTLSVQNVVLQDNEAVNGGAISAEGRVSLSVRNVIIANNRGSNGAGGVLLEGANGDVTARFRNTTITANAASFHAGGVVVDNVARLTLINSIVWNNSLSEVAQFSGARVSVSFSDVGERLFPGPGNLSANPRFHDPASRDYRLRPSSPAIDAGTNINAPLTDIRGLRRPVDGNGDGIAVTDMGAFEFGKIFLP
jgi:predicted outer membrane repeat protein